MSFSKGAGADGYVFDSHFMYFFHNHVYNQVTIAEMMMET